MTDQPDETPADVGDSVTIGPTSSPADIMTALGFDPALVQAVILTPTGAVAVAVDYPDPTPPATPDPEEQTDAPD